MTRLWNEQHGGFTVGERRAWVTSSFKNKLSCHSYSIKRHQIRHSTTSVGPQSVRYFVEDKWNKRGRWVNKTIIFYKLKEQQLES